MIGDDDDKRGEDSNSTRATSVESKLGLATPQDPSPPGKAETHARLSTCTPQHTTEPIDRPTFRSAALLQQSRMGVVGADDHAVAMVANTPSASPLPLSPPSPAPAPAFALEEEWEIRKIVAKRRVGSGYVYKVRWKDTCLRRSELGNAQGLLQEFEARCRAQPGSKPRKATRFGKAG